MSGPRLWAVTFVGFFLIFGAWSFAAPYDGPPDEVQHVIRAAGVVSGQIAPKLATLDNWNGKGADGMGAMQRVPEGLHRPATCWGFEPWTSASCARPITDGPTRAVPSSAGRYNPAYYAAVGLPVLLWPGWGGLVIARLISAALCAALLAWAFVALARWSRHGLMLAALLACTTPMVGHLAGAVNPNGLEIIAGISLFAAAIPLLFGRPGAKSTADGAAEPDDPAATSLIWLVGVSAVVLATLRSLGPLWVVGGFAALLVPASRASLRRLWGRRLVRWWGAGIVVALALSAAWIELMKTGDVIASGEDLPHYGVGQAVISYFDRWGDYLRGMIGIAGWFDIQMPMPFYTIWIVASASLILFGLVVATRAERWRFLVILVAGVAVPGALQIMTVNKIGWFFAGRYSMPLLVAMPLLGAFLMEQRMVTARQSRTIARTFCLLLVPIHLVLLDYAMVRWQRGTQPNPGFGRLSPFAGSWHPATGSVLPVAIMLVGMVVVGWMFSQPAALRLPGTTGGASVSTDSGDAADAPADTAPVNTAPVDGAAADGAAVGAVDAPVARRHGRPGDHDLVGSAERPA
jgi:hypothetical protein